MKAHAKKAMAFGEKLVYHAPQAQRLRTERLR
jgi:hypothetical protein